MKRRIPLVALSLVYFIVGCEGTAQPTNTSAPQAGAAIAASTPLAMTSTATSVTVTAVQAAASSPTLAPPTRQNDENCAANRIEGEGTAMSGTAGRDGSGRAAVSRLRTSNTIRDVVNHPAFSGFGQFILPLDRGSHDDAMPLQDVASLLPYHSNIDPEAAVSAINYLVDKRASGETVFYDFYTDAQKQEDPSRKSTGLFFFRGKPGAPFAVISPGGGFSYVGSVHEGFPYAIALSRKGYNAFVLQYRVGSERRATEDLAAALSYIVRNANTLGVGADGYSVWGSSAGARMAARIGSSGSVAYGGAAIAGPSTVVMAYTGHTDFTANDPPTFAIVGESDGIASPSTMERRVTAMRSAGIDVELRVYPSVGHGFGLGTGTTAEGWLDDAVRFWEKYMPASAGIGVKRSC